MRTELALLVLAWNQCESEVHDGKVVSTITLSAEQQGVVADACRLAFPDGRAERPDRLSTEEAVSGMYGKIGLPAPTFFWVDNPLQLMQAPFLLQTLASVPHGAQRRTLRRTKCQLPPADLGWQLQNKLEGQWLQSYISLCEQLTPAILSKLSQFAHHESTRVQAYDQPDVLHTCGSRLGFPVAPALKALLNELVLRAYSCVASKLSLNVCRELNAIYRTDASRRGWNSRATVAAAMAGRTGQQDIFAHIGDLIDTHGSLPQSTIDQLIMALARQVGGAETLFYDLDFTGTFVGSIPANVMFSLIGELGELTDEIADLQDTTCHHTRVDGTSALQTASYPGENRRPVQILVDASRNPIYSLIWGRWSRDQLCLLQAVKGLFSDIYSSGLSAILQDFLTMRDGAFAYVLNSRCVFACPLPSAVHFDEAVHLHNFDGPALQFADGYELHCWRGVAVTDDDRRKHETLRLDLIEQERNIELRRVLIDHYGTARFLEESGARQVQEDEYGVLYCKDLPGDEALVMVRVVNSTAEPDGSFKHYYLRVPPAVVRTAHAAVAWTFGMAQHEYHPERQT